MKRWKDFNTTEKMMIAMILMLIVCIFLSWGRITNGVAKGFSFFGITDKTSTAQIDSLN